MRPSPPVAATRAVLAPAKALYRTPSSCPLSTAEIDEGLLSDCCTGEQLNELLALGTQGMRGLRNALDPPRRTGRQLLRWLHQPACELPRPCRPTRRRTSTH